MPLTSRITQVSTVSLSEALLLIDNPAPGSQYPCPFSTCPFIIGQPLGPGSTQNKNVYHGTVTGTNSVTFVGVPIVAPGINGGTRHFSIVNLRGAPSTGPVIATMAVTGTGAFTLTGNSGAISLVPVANSFALRDPTDTNSTPGSFPGTTPLNPAVGPTTNPTFLLKYGEPPFVPAFKRRNGATTVANPTALAAENSGFYGGTETMFFEPAFPSTNGLNIAGLPTQGTRFQARFTGIPAGVTLYAATSPGPVGTNLSPNVRLIDPISGSIVSPTQTIAGGTGVAPLTVTSGTAVATWEVLEFTSSEGNGSYAFPIVVSYSTPVAPATVNVSMSLGPIDTDSVPAASATAPVPRFKGGTPTTAFTLTGTVLSITTTSLPAGQVGVAYPSTTMGATGGAAPYTWSPVSGLPPGLSLSSAGVITGTPTTAVGSPFSFTAQVTDVTGQTTSATIPITIRPRVSVSTTSLPAGQVGVPYPATAMSATGGLPSYTWAAVSGLPPGLALSAAGQITGTPTTAVGSPFSFIAQVTDSVGQTATATIPVTIRAAVTITTTTLPNGQVAVVYPATPLNATGGIAPYTWSLTGGALPPGLSLSAGGTITGTPTGSGGQSDFTVQAADAQGQTASANLSIVVRAALTVTTTSVPPGQVGVAYPTTPVNAAGGLTPYSWDVFTVALPPGLVLSASGVITGTPITAGTFNTSVRVTDAGGATATATLAITIRSRLTITTTSLPFGTTNVAYPATTLAATGGLAPYGSWSLLTGSLPTGLSLSPAGVISGTPSAAGTFNFTVQLGDAAGQTATANLSISVESQPRITTSSVPAGQVGVAYASTQLLATGGTTPYSWGLPEGSTLPAGLTLSQTGVIGGTPTGTSGTFNFTAHLTDARERTATAILSITIRPRVSITTTSLPTGQVGIAYGPVKLTGAGGLAPYSWSAGTLPPGLALASDGTISGTPTAGGANFSLIATIVDATEQTATATFSVRVNGRVSISSISLPDGTLNTRYGPHQLQAGGGTAPFLWSVGSTGASAATPAKADGPRTADGSLPPGLSLDPSGVVSGIPTTPGFFTFTVTVTDALGQQASGSVSMTIIQGVTFATVSVPKSAVECRLSSLLEATGGSAPYTWAATGLPPGLSITPRGEITGQALSDGTYDVTFVVTDSNGLVTRQIVPFTVAPVLSIIAPDSLDDVTVGDPIPMAFGANGGSPPYTFSLESGALPNGVSIDSQGLLAGRATRAGDFGLTVRVTDSCGRVARRAYALRVVPTNTDECSISLRPDALKYTLQQGTGPSSKRVGVGAKCGADIPLNVEIDQPAGQNWLTVSRTSLVSTLKEAAGVNIVATPGSLPVGTYTGSVTLSGRVNSVIPVVMTVTAAPFALQVSPAGLIFSAVQNGPNPAPQTVNVIALPRGPLPWSATTFTTSGGAWLSLTSAAGSTDLGPPGISTVTVQASPVGLAPGEYYGSIEFSGAGAVNSPKSVTVVLNVAATDTQLVPTPDRSGFIVTDASPRTVTITNPARSTATFTTSRHPLEGRLWFSVDPPSGTIAPGSALSLRIIPDPAAFREPGVRRSLLVIRFSDANVITIELVLIVPRITSSNDRKNEEQRTVAGCSPTKLVGVFTTLQQNFNVPVGWPNGIDMQIVDDCAEPLTTGSSTIGFSCCDSPKPLIPLRQGIWSTTWVARAPANTEVAITSDFVNDTQLLKGTHSVTGVVARIGNPPIISDGGAINAATFTLRQPLAPGVLTSVFGQRMADAAQQTQSLPLSTTLGATSASLGGKLLPLFFTSDGQVNAQIPFDVPTNTELNLIVRRGAALSAPETVTIAPASPGVFTKNQAGTGQAAVVDVQGRLIEPGNAAPRGGVAILFTTGLGVVDQPVNAGFPAPGAEPLARTTIPAIVTVGGSRATILYSGLAPGFVGLYQINFLIPNDAPTGDGVPINVTLDSSRSNSATIAIR